MIDIKYNSGKQIRYTTPINEGCVWKKELMKHDYVLLKFSTATLIDFQKGDYIETTFGRYEMINKVFPSFNKSTGGYDYELTFEALHYKWKNHILFYDRDKNKEASWSLTRTPDTHLSIILSNLSALEYTHNGTEYTFAIDESVDQSAKFISYDNVNILDALTKIAETWEAEWWIENSVIHIGRCEYKTAIDFVMNDNVSNMSRSSSNENFATRIYAFGSTRNIPANYRSSQENVVVNGVVQKRLMLPGEKNCVDAYDPLPPEEVVESVVIFDDVYPRRIGTISSVSTKICTDTIENEDGSKTTEKWNAYRFKDEGIKFSKDYIIPGEEIRITFTSGDLNGMNFGVAFNPHADDEQALPEKNPDGSWNAAAQVFEIIRSEDYGIPLPNDIYKPKPTDNYILYGFDISLVSDSYIKSAEDELQQRAEQYVEKSKEDPSVYDCTMNLTDQTLDNNDLDVGDRVKLINPTYFDENGRQSRIYAFEKHLDGSQVSYTVGNTAKYSRLANVENEIKEIVYEGNAYSGSGGGIHIIGRYDDTVPSNRNVFSAKRSMVEFLSTKYPSTAQRTITFKDGIHVDKEITLGEFVPGSSGAGIYQDGQGNWHVDTDFLNIRKKLSAEEIEIQTTSHVGGKLISSAASMLCSNVEDHGAYWRCYFNQEDENGRKIENQFRANDLAYVETFNLEKNDDGTTSNHFLWRLVIKADENYIDIIKSEKPEHACDGSDAPLVGDNIIQLGNTSDPYRQGAIILASAGSLGDTVPFFRVYDGINDFKLPDPKIDLNPKDTSITAESITLKSTGKNVKETIEDFAVDVEKVKEQNDGMWVLWFGADIPTLENFPASDWETDELRAEHVQDILVIDNKNDEENNGKAYRFIQAENGSFEWNEITDQYLVQALKTANDSKRLAEGKTRNFFREPEDSDEYAPGDTWSNATYPKGEGTIYENEYLVSKSYKAAGIAFDINHWQPVNKVTSKTFSTYKQTVDEISSTVDRITFDEEGNVKNITTSGFVTTSEFSKMFSKAVDENGDIVKQSEIETFVKVDEDGYIESGIKLKADQIELEGNTFINENFFVDENGDLFLNNITADNARVTGEINAQSGVVGGFHISGTGLTNRNEYGNFTNDAYIIFRNDPHNCFAGIGGNVLPATSGARGIARFENHDKSDWWGLGTNYALLVSAQGSANNVAINMDGGYIAGMAIKTGHYMSSSTISRSVVSAVTLNTIDITLTLPTMELYDDGHVIKIKRLSSAAVNLRAGSSYHMVNGVRVLSNSYISFNAGDAVGGSDNLRIDSKGDAMELVYHRDIELTSNNVVKYRGCWVQYKNPRDW